MKSSRLSVTTFVLLGLICVINANLITNLLGKSDEKTETDDKAAVTTTSTAKPADGGAAVAGAGAAAAAAAAGAAAPAAAGTTTTADPGTSCGGLKGFFHICNKGESTEPPKIVKTRSVDDDDSSSSSEENSHELKEMRRKKEAEEEEADDDEDDDDDDVDEVDNQEKQSSTSEATSTTESQAIKKRETEVEDEKNEKQTQRERLNDYPLESAVFAMLKKRSVEETNDEESKPMNATEGTPEEEEKEGEVRRRRDCGDGWKDCRRKREFVPCVQPKCMRSEQETENE